MPQWASPDTKKSLEPSKAVIAALAGMLVPAGLGLTPRPQRAACAQVACQLAHFQPTGQVGLTSVLHLQRGAFWPGSWNVC